MRRRPHGKSVAQSGSASRREAARDFCWGREEVDFSVDQARLMIMMWQEKKVEIIDFVVWPFPEIPYFLKLKT